MRAAAGRLLHSQRLLSVRPATRAASGWRRATPPSAAAAAAAAVGAPPPDEVLRTISENGQVSILAVRGTALVREACARHGAAPTASAALGRALLGTLLIGCFRGEGEKTQVTIRGGGPIGTVQCIAEATGRVKGLVGDASVDPPLRADGKLDVGAAVGRAGVCAVVRSPPFTDKGWEQPYTGMVALESGEIAEDLAAYLAESEQVQCALALGVSVGRDGAVDGAGGYLVQVLPFADDETLAALEANIAAAGPVTAMLAEGLGPREVTARLLEGLGAGDEGFSLEPSYGPCDAEELRERMRRAIATLGEGEARAILEEQGRVEMTCEFCRVTHALDEAEVMAAVAAAQA